MDETITMMSYILLLKDKILIDSELEKPCSAAAAMEAAGPGVLTYEAVHDPKQHAGGEFSVEAAAVPLFEEKLQELKGWINRGCPTTELLEAYAACQTGEDRQRVRDIAHGVCGAAHVISSANFFFLSRLSNGHRLTARGLRRSYHPARL